MRLFLWILATICIYEFVLLLWQCQQWVYNFYYVYYFRLNAHCCWENTIYVFHFILTRNNIIKVGREKMFVVRYGNEGFFALKTTQSPSTLPRATKCTNFTHFCYTIAFRVLKECSETLLCTCWHPTVKPRLQFSLGWQYTLFPKLTQNFSIYLTIVIYSWYFVCGVRACIWFCVFTYMK